MLIFNITTHRRNVSRVVSTVHNKYNMPENMTRLRRSLRQLAPLQIELAQPLEEFTLFPKLPPGELGP